MATVLEGALLAAGRALSVDELLSLFEGHPEAPDRELVREGLSTLDASLTGRAIELTRVASGYRLQVRAEHSTWLAGLFTERPPRYSRALLETLALIAYRQPITRGEIEEVRGVAVSSNIVKTLMEREWIRTLGHREVPGRPALYGTTRAFLDHFGLKGLDGLPALAELKDLDQVEQDLFAELPPAREPGEDEPQVDPRQDRQEDPREGPEDGPGRRLEQASGEAAMQQPEQESGQEPAWQAAAAEALEPADAAEALPGSEPDPEAPDTAQGDAGAGLRDGP
jgi:segregation and condensation protein B